MGGMELKDGRMSGCWEREGAPVLGGNCQGAY